MGIELDLVTKDASGNATGRSQLDGVSGAAKVHLASGAGVNAGQSVQEVALASEPIAVTATGQIVTGPCYVLGFTTKAGTTPTLALYSGTDTSGIMIHPAVTETIGSPRTLPGAVYCPNGLYGVVGGTASPTFTVFVRR